MRHAPAIAIAVFGSITALFLWQPSVDAVAKKTGSDPASTSVQQATWLLEEEEADEREEHAESRDATDRLNKISERLERLDDYDGPDADYWTKESKEIEDQIRELLREHPDLKDDRQLKWMRRLMVSMQPPSPPRQPRPSTPEATPPRYSAGTGGRAVMSEPGLYSLPPSARQPTAGSYVQESPSAPAGGLADQRLQQRALSPNIAAQAAPLTQSDLGGPMFAPSPGAVAPSTGGVASSAMMQSSLSAQPSQSAFAYRPADAAAPVAAMAMQAMPSTGLAEQWIYQEGRTRWRLQRLPTDGFNFLGLGSIHWVKYQEPGKLSRRLVYLPTGG